MIANKHFHFIVPVWGETFTKTFADICLPMILTPGNLGAFDGGGKDCPVVMSTWKEPARGCDTRSSDRTGAAACDRFVILTTWNDSLTIRASHSFERLRKMIQVEFIFIDSFVKIDQAHASMSKCYSRAMRSKNVVPGETYFVFLTPDSFFPEGMFRRLIDLAEQGFRVAMIAGLRTNSELMAPILKKRINQFPNDPSMPTNELIRLCLSNMHPVSSSLDWLSGKMFCNAWPANIYWIDKQRQQVVAHCFHLHPLMVLAPKAKMRIGQTIDGDYLKNLPYSLDRYYVDRGEFILVDLTAPERRWPKACLGSPSVNAVIRFGLFYANSRHWYFFSKRIVWNAGVEKHIDPFFEKTIGMFVAEIQRYRRLALLIQNLKILQIFNWTKWSIGLMLKVPRRLFRIVFGSPSR